MAVLLDLEVFAETLALTPKALPPAETPTPDEVPSVVVVESENELPTFKFLDCPRFHPELCESELPFVSVVEVEELVPVVWLEFQLVESLSL